MLMVAEPTLGEDEKRALAAVVDSGWITMGERVHEFEGAFANRHGVGAAVAVSSCTAGLHLALEALRIGPGDEVLVPSLSFVATANCVLYSGATPVFVDIESTDVPLLCCADAAAKCGPKTKAVVVMHYGGYLVERSVWRDFAQARGLYLIEDAAHIAGLDPPGIGGDVAVFSFFGNKNMTTAEGGMVLTRDKEVLDRIRRMRSHGMTMLTLQRLSRPTLDYDVTELGYNYRMDELRAAIGLVQLSKLREWNDKRRVLTETYRTLLRERSNSVAIPFSQPRRSAYHVLPVMLPVGTDRQLVADRMRDAGIQTSFHYPPIHRLSWYRSRFPDTVLPKTEDFCSRELTLPLHPKMSEPDVETVVDILIEALA
jgi:dTDP-4-amino-4,6-dideoxygalactose transaminase